MFKRVNSIKRLIRYPGQNGLRIAFSLKKRISSHGDYIFVACMPKSGSTFMAKALSELTGYRYVELAYAYERNEENLYLPKLIDSYSFGSVTHLHVRATNSNIDLMNTFSIRPVILVRNIFDIVVSIRDHLFQEGFEFPTFFCNEKFGELTEKEQFDFIIEQGLPWYFNFYVSWYAAVLSGNIKALWMIFEDVVSDWKEALSNVAQFYGIQKTDKEIEKALERMEGKRRQEIRLNKGKVGRGSSELTNDQKEKIVSLARFYPWVDFSKIGIIKTGNTEY